MAKKRLGRPGHPGASYSLGVVSWRSGDVIRMKKPSGSAPG
jgi:hypothetical protein